MGMWREQVPAEEALCDQYAACWEESFILTVTSNEDRWTERREIDWPTYTRLPIDGASSDGGAGSGMHQHPKRAERLMRASITRSMRAVVAWTEAQLAQELTGNDIVVLLFRLESACFSGYDQTLQ